MPAARCGSQFDGRAESLVVQRSDCRRSSAHGENCLKCRAVAPKYRVHVRKRSGEKQPRGNGRLRWP